MLSEFDSFLSVLHNHSFTFDLSTHFILNLGAAPSVYCTCFFLLLLAASQVDLCMPFK